MCWLKLFFYLLTIYCGLQIVSDTEESVLSKSLTAPTCPGRLQANEEATPSFKQ